MQTIKSSSITTPYRGQRDLHSREEILHIEGKEYFHSSCNTHPCMLQDLPKAFQSFKAFSHSRQFYMLPVLQGIPPYYSILQLECIFYTSTGLHRNSTEYQLRHYKLQTHILQRKGDVALSVEMDTHSRIELIPAIVFSSKSANYKNDIS